MREETEFRPKPLVMIGDRPILWHIMKIYSFYGFRDFILCAGYKGDMIKRYFMEMRWLNNDFTVSTGAGTGVTYHTENDENWNVTVVDTGLESKTGTRVKLVKKYIDSDEFMLTYGDGLADVDLPELCRQHRLSGKTATLTGVNPNSPFGVIRTRDGTVTSFKEKPVLKDVINGGFMVLSKSVFDYIPEEDCAFEQEPLRRMAADSELSVYRHRGFWIPVDTYKDVEKVNDLWNAGEAPWKLWN